MKDKNFSREFRERATCKEGQNSFAISDGSGQSPRA
jgi:hypothetical protein